jgi:hypothetical protein
MKKSRFRAFVPFSGESRAEMDRPRSGRGSDSKPDRADPRSKSGRGVVGGASQSPMLKEPLCGFSSPKTNVVTEPRYLDRIWTTARYCWPCFPMAVTFAGSGVMLRILQQGTHQLREVRVRKSRFVELLLRAEKRILRRLEDAEPNHGFGGNLNLLLLLWIDPSASFPLVFTSFQAPNSRSFWRLCRRWR